MTTETVNPLSSLPLRKTLLVIMLVQLALFLLVVLAPGKVSLAVVLGISVILFYALTKNPLMTSILLSVAVAIILPQTFGRRFGIKIEEVFPLFTLFFLMLASIQGNYEKRPIGKIGYLLLAFLFAAFIAAMLGFIKDRSKILIVDELLMFLAWGYYFIIIKCHLSEPDIKRIFYAIVISSILVSLYYILEFRILSGAMRFRTDQQHIFNVTIPFLFAIFLYHTRKTTRTLAIVLMIPMFIAVYVTLTRALWLFVPLALVFQYLYFIRSNIRYARISQWLVPLVIIVMVGGLGIVVLNQMFGVQALLGGRLASFKFLEYDASLLARVELGQYVLQRFKASPIFGSGLADFLRYLYFPTLGRFNVYWLDNSYLQLLWKTGAVGLLLFLIFIYIFLRRAWYVLKNAVNESDRILGSSMLFSFIALVISSFQCGILVGYRFNFVWAVLFAIVEIRAQQIIALKKQPKIAG